YLNEDGVKATAAFAAARSETLRRLQALPESTWDRAARHAIFGPTNFTEVVGFMADHDRLHVQQAWRTLQSPA
ncbi:MAG: DinB family protein, partial [Anaerolineales bacterium]